MINDTLEVFQQFHQVPAEARPKVLTRDTTATVKTIGRYLPRKQSFTWQQQIVENVRRCYHKTTGI